MNTIQKRYAAAVALESMLKDEEKEIEQEVIKEMNLTDESGKLLTTLYIIGDEDIYRKASDLFERKLAAVHYTARLGKALEEKSKAADALIEWSLKMFEEVHPSEAKILKENSKRYSTRLKLIELAMKI
jgi:hypothetical protein